MKTDEIKILLEAFYNGETNEKEELILSDYFNSDNVSDELLEEKHIFLQIYQSDPIDIPQNLEAKLENIIDELAKNETIKPNQSKKHFLTWIGSIAAGIAILITAGIYYNKPSNSSLPFTHTTNKAEAMSKSDQEALEDGQDALILLSSKFNKGMDQLAVVSTNINKTSDALNKAINKKKGKES